MRKPDYTQSIVNLMASLRLAFGGAEGPYPPLALLPPGQIGQRAVLLIVDGLGYARAQALAGTSLQRYLRGALDSVFPTATVSAITSFYTGVAPGQHGMTGWFTWFRELGSVAMVLPFVPRGGGSSYTATGMDPARLFAHDSLFSRIASPGWVINPAHIADSAYSLACGGAAGRRSYNGLDDFFSQLSLTSREAPGLVLGYWPQYDALCHHDGVHSEQATRLLLDFDAHLTRFIDEASASGATVIVTGDHGALDTQPERIIRIEDHPTLRADLTLPLCGEPRVAFCYVHARRREHFLDYVRSHFDECCHVFPSDQLVAEGWFGTGEPHPELLHRIGDYALVTKENYLITERLPGERPLVQVGTHGGISAAELEVPLIVASP